MLTSFHAQVLAFANSSDAKVSKDAFLFLAHHDMSAVQLNQKLVEILMEGDISWDLMATVLLQAKSIPVSGRLVATLIARAETDTCHIDVDRALDTPPGRLGHGAPVLESVAYQGIRRYGRDRIVEVAHLDGIKRDLGHRTVRAILLHRNPIAGT